LRNFGRKTGAVSIYYPAEAQTETAGLIMKVLQLLDWPKRRFQYTIREKFNNS
jgi:hypothetical protein